MGTKYEPTEEIKALYKDIKWEKGTKLEKRWEIQVCLLFQRAIERLMSEISEIQSESTRMKVTSSEGKVFHQIVK